MGISFGGYLAPRAAAFDHRIAACIANEGVYDFNASVMQKALRILPNDRSLYAEGRSPADQVSHPCCRFGQRHASAGPGKAALRRPDHLEREDIQLAGWSAARGLMPAPAFDGSG